MSSAPRSPPPCARLSSSLRSRSHAAPRAPGGGAKRPQFAFGKPEEVKPQAPAVEWKVQARAGLNQTSGNSQTTNVTAGLTASRKEGNNKLALDGGSLRPLQHLQVATFDDDGDADRDHGAQPAGA